MPIDRIALLAPFGLRPKGTTTSRVLPIGRVLAAQGASVRLVIPPWDDPASAGQTSQDGSLEIVQAPIRGGPLQSIALLRDLSLLVRDFEPQVVHVFKPIGYSGLLGSWWARTWRGTGAPLLVLDCDDQEGPAGWAGRKGLRALGLIRGLQEVLAIRDIGRVTAASRWLETYVQRLGVPPADTLYLPNGCELGPSERDRSDVDRRDPALLWYTRFTEADPAHAAAWLSPILQRHPGLRLIVFGDEVERGAKERTSAGLMGAGVGDQVEWLDYAPGRLHELVTSRDLVAVYPLDDDLTNRARCPAKIVELMSLEIPVVAEAVGEASNYLGSLASVCLAPPGDANAFCELVSKLVEDADLRGLTGTRATAAASRFDWQRLAGGLPAWYEALRDA